MTNLRRAMASAWIRPAPDASPDRQMLFGDTFTVEKEQDGWTKGVTQKDAYPGWVKTDALAHPPSNTKSTPYQIKVRSTWGYGEPNLKSAPLVDLHMTSSLSVTDQHQGWLEFIYGDKRAYVPAPHCTDKTTIQNDPTTAARLFLGVPYVWAGNTGFGLDCSGLMQIAMRAAGMTCPADSHQQETMIKGDTLQETDALLPGDLIFWKGHVAMTTTPTTIIHANAHHMAVTEEPIDTAIARIKASDTGAITSRLRPAPASSVQKTSG